MLQALFHGRTFFFLIIPNLHYFYFQNYPVCPELEKVKKIARNLMNPSQELTDHGYTCNLMLLSNLREPEWVPVNCKEKLLHFAICKYKRTNYNNYNIQDLYFCKSTNLLVNNKCYIFLWNNIWNTSQYCNKFQAKGISLNEFNSLYHIFNAVYSVDTFPNIIFHNNHNLHVIKIFKLFDRIHLKHIYKHTPTFSGYTICT